MKLPVRFSNDAFLICMMLLSHAASVFVKDYTAGIHTLPEFLSSMLNLYIMRDED